MNEEIKLPGAYGRNYGSKGKIQELDGICDTLIAGMGAGGGNVPLVKEKNMDNNKEKIICEQRCDEGLRFFKDNICGSLRTIDACGDKRVLEVDNATIIREEPLEREGWHRNAKEVLSVDGICRTLSTQSNNLATKIKEQPSLRIRKLTPKECFRLQGFDDYDFEKAEKVNSNTQLYKQAGNSICVPTIQYILKNIFECGALNIE